MNAISERPAGAAGEPCVLAETLLPPAADAVRGVIARFCERTGIPPSTFGRMAMGDPRFFWDLKFYRTPRPAALLRVAAFIALWGERRWDDEPPITGKRGRKRVRSYRLRREGDLFILQTNDESTGQ